MELEKMGEEKHVLAVPPPAYALFSPTPSYFSEWRTFLMFR